MEEPKIIPTLENNPPEDTKQHGFLRKRFWLVILMVVVLGLAVNLLLPQIKALEHSWSVVKDLTWWALGLAMLAQVGFYASAGFMIHTILDANNHSLSIFKCAMIYMASYSVGLVAGGWVAGAAATVGWVKNESNDGQTALLAGALPTLLMNASLVSLAVIGIVYLLFVHDLTQGQLIQYLITISILGLITFGELAALRYPQVATKVWIWAAGRWAKLVHKTSDPQKITEKMDRFVEVWHSLRGRSWIKTLLGALGVLVFDMMTLFFVFLAAGYTLNPGALLAGYSLPLLLSKVIFLFPGGVGLVEVTMVALFSGLTGRNQVSLVATLGYRLFSFWIPTIIGFVMAGVLSRNTWLQARKRRLRAEKRKRDLELGLKRVVKKP